MKDKIYWIGYIFIFSILIFSSNNVKASRFSWCNREMMGNPEKRQSDIAYENSLNETLELLINDISHGKFDFLSTGFGNCPFLTDCDASKIPYFQIGYNCYTYSIQNISDVFRSCEKLAVFLQVKNFVNYKKDKETREPKIKGSEFCQNLCSDSGKCPLYNKNNKLESLKDLVNKFKGHIMECLDMDKKPHNPLHFNIHKKKSKLLETFFPFSPTINSILATFYVSGPPNFILAFIPHNINKHILSVFVAFAIGGFFGDILLHLLPEVFLDKKTDEDFNIALFDKQKNIVISFFILTGFICFMLIDRTLRLFLEHDSNHGHNKKHTEDSDDKKHDKPVAVSTSISLKSDDTNDIKKRIVVNDEKKEDPPVSSEKNPKPALSGYLNLIADFFHNFTDGLALSTSFYVSPITGMTTTMTIFFHEIPREFGDFAVILHSGFTKYQALSCQFVTATSTFLGAFVGIILNKFSTSFSNIEAHFFNTSILPNNLILSFIIGTFLYVGTVGIVHELLNDKNSGFFVIFFQLFAIFLGFGCMLII